MPAPSAPNPPVGGQPPAAQPPSAVPKKTKRLGDYELIGKLGQGAMGSVYLAEQISQRRKVAMKILPQDMAKDTEFLERFRREARAASRISHPNVVAAYDVGLVDNFNYIAMEFIDGPNLELVLQKKGRFSEEEVLKVAIDMASALEAAEAQKIVHRDIKPANILMNSRGVCKLTDMGLASASQGDQRVTMAGYAVGTPFYISPEQARGELEVDSRSDIYSLGASLYHLATGTLPFPGTNPVIIMTKHIQEMPQPPHERCPAVPLRLSLMIMKMMAKNAAERYQRAGDVKAEAERMLRGEAPQLHKTGKGSTPPEVKSRVPHTVHAEKAHAASASMLDRVLTLPDILLPFLPEGARLPVLATALTATFVAVIWLLIKLLQ